MSMFLDIADEGQKGTTKVRNTDVDIVGLSSRQIARLLVNHESLETFLNGGAANINLTQLVQMAPDAVAQAIAYGTGYEDDKDYGGDESKFKQACVKAAKLNAGEQYDLLRAIFDTTFGERLNPFVKMLAERVGQRVAANVKSRAAPSTKSVKELRDSLRSATTPEMFGATHQGNSPATPS